MIRRSIPAGFACLWICVAGLAGCKKENPAEPETVRSALPEAPVGYRWRAVPQLSDEFDGAGLDASKWMDFHPYWDGREPSRFDPRNVSLSAGILRLVSVPLVSDLGTVRNPEKDVWVGSACVSSRSASASYGYYEARIRASDLSMTSSFWFQGKFSEIDVVEQLGRPVKNAWKSDFMMMNTHYFAGGWEADAATPVQWKMPSGSSDGYHVYGVWWRDSETAWFYHEGEKVAEARFGGEFVEPMYLFFDTEVFIWDGLPTIASLNDPAANAMLVDWVRAWTLTRQ
jgi:hypothetical protein